MNQTRTTDAHPTPDQQTKAQTAAARLTSPTARNLLNHFITTITTPTPTQNPVP